VAPGQHPWASLEAAARLRLRLPFHLHADLMLPVVVPLVRQAFTVAGGSAPVFQAAPIGLLPSAGLGASFP
jgi:hypothetical protein